MVRGFSRRALGIVGYLLTLIAGGLLFFFVFAAGLFDSDSASHRTNFLTGWLNIIGTPIISIWTGAYLLQMTWGKRAGFVGAAIAVFGLALLLVLYILPGFFP